MIKSRNYRFAQCGKSTIINAPTKSTVPSENYLFCTINLNVGIVEIPYYRLNNITNIINPETISLGTVEFVDIAGLI